MSNPDTPTSASSGSVSINALSVAVPAAASIFVLTLILFYNKDSLPFFTAILWIGVPLIAFLVAAGMNLASQYMYCKTTQSGKAFLGAIPSILAVLVGLAISSVSYCRIPVASLAVPFYVSESKSKGCEPLPSLESIEAKAPMVSGLSYGFYLFFSMLFGIVLGSGTAVVC